MKSDHMSRAQVVGALKITTGMEIIEPVLPRITTSMMQESFILTTCTLALMMSWEAGNITTGLLQPSMRGTIEQRVHSSPENWTGIMKPRSELTTWGTLVKVHLMTTVSTPTAVCPTLAALIPTNS